MKGDRRNAQQRLTRPPLVLVWLLLWVVWAFAGCGISVPTDPDHTLDRVRGGVLRVGASVNDPWIIWTSEAEPAGREADLVRAFAESLDARVEWVRGGEESLMNRLEDGELDVVAAGLTGETPWMEKAAITKPYLTVQGRGGANEEHVLAVPLGENAFLLTLERFLLQSHPGRR